MRRIDLIVIHCTASRPDQHLTLGMLDKMHQAKGWKCCGYHYYITRDGQLHFGRPEEMVGAHARHYNAHSIGVCYEGGLDEKGRAADTRTPAQKKALLTLLLSLKRTIPMPRSSATANWRASTRLVPASHVQSTATISSTSDRQLCIIVSKSLAVHKTRQGFLL